MNICGAVVLTAVVTAGSAALGHTHQYRTASLPPPAALSLPVDPMSAGSTMGSNPTTAQTTIADASTPKASTKDKVKAKAKTEVKKDHLVDH